ncbi:MAG TPA: D-2-hydroxyacid dehydrogenase family protein [Burkholderiales bacterium]|nr:D-2-hydroxyacid dehydrogenase family protein [Burkholderiales bacterium]
MKIAVLNDYLRLSQQVADWSRIAATCETTVFDRAIAAEDAAEVLRPFEIIVTLRERMPLPRALLERLPNLKLIAITGLYNRVLDVAAAVERGIVVSYTELRGTYRKATCELTWGLILSVARHIPYEASEMRNGGWQHTAGITLAGRTLGLVGLGRQGRYMVPVAKAFDMNVIAWSRNMTAEAAAEVGARRVEKDELFRRSDIVSIHLALGERSRGTVGERELALMKPTAILVNAARGPIVDEKALLEALRARRIAGAGLDVFEQEPLPEQHPLRALDNVVLTPHLGHNVREFYEVAFSDVVENIAAFLKGTPLRLLTPERNTSALVR